MKPDGGGNQLPSTLKNVFICLHFAVAAAVQRNCWCRWMQVCTSSSTKAVWQSTTWMTKKRWILSM